MSARLLTRSPFAIAARVRLRDRRRAARAGRLSSGPRTFASPEDAAKALIEVAKAGKLEDLMTLLGP